MARSAGRTLALSLAMLAACGPVSPDAATDRICPSGHITIQRFIAVGSLPLLPCELCWEDEWNPEIECLSSPQPTRSVAVCSRCKYRFRNTYWYRGGHDPSTFARPLEPLIAQIPLSPATISSRIASFFQALAGERDRMEIVLIDGPEDVAAAWTRVLHHFRSMKDAPRDMVFIANHLADRHQRGTWKGYEVEVRVVAREDSEEARTILQISNSPALPLQH